jgi:hypothetical protein
MHLSQFEKREIRSDSIFHVVMIKPEKYRRKTIAWSTGSFGAKWQLFVIAAME